MLGQAAGVCVCRLVCRSGTMSTIKWVKYQDFLQQVRPKPEGRLSVKQIASNFGLDVVSIDFDGIFATYDSNGFTSEVIRGG